MWYQTSKFIIALICFIMINTSIGYMDKLKNPVFALLLSVICAFLPGGFTLIVLSAFILIQLYVIAPEFALLVLCVMLLMYLLYFRFAPKTAYILIITAMFCSDEDTICASGSDWSVFVSCGSYTSEFWCYYVLHNKNCK
ncbi:MAG: hypothetical protein ACLR7D_10520 [Lachnospira eligens]